MSANTLKIIVNNQPLDLFTRNSQRFFLTRQIHDLRNLNVRNGDFSRDLTIPATSANVVLFFDVIPGTPLVRNIWKKFSATILFGEVTVAANADLFLIDYLQDKKQIRIRFVFGNSVFFELMHTKTLQDINWFDASFTWAASQLLGNSQKVDNTYVFADMDYIEGGEKRFGTGGGNPLTTYRITSAGGMFVFHREFLKRIVESNGYKLDLKALYNIYRHPDTIITDSNGLLEVTFPVVEAEAAARFEAIIIGGVDLVVYGNTLDDPRIGVQKYGEVLSKSQPTTTSIRVILNAPWQDPAPWFVSYFQFKHKTFNSTGLCIPVTQFAEALDPPAIPYEPAVQITSPFVKGPGAGFTQLTGFTVTNDEPVGAWDNTRQAFFVATPYTLINFIFDAPANRVTVTGNGTKIFEFRKNDRNIRTVTVNNFGGRQTYSVFTTCEPGDLITFGYRFYTDAEDESISLSEEFGSITVIGTADRGSGFALQDYMPTLKQTAMFGEIMKTFNLITEVDTLSKTVFVSPFDSVFDITDLRYNYFIGNVPVDYVQANNAEDVSYVNAGAESLAADWSRNYDSSRSPKYLNYIPSWFRNNIFAWNDAQIQRTDTDAEFPMANEQLQERGNKIQSLFAAMDNSPIIHFAGTSQSTSINPVYEIDDGTSMGETARVGAILDRLTITAEAEGYREGDFVIFLGGTVVDAQPRLIRNIIAGPVVVVNTAYSAQTNVDAEWIILRPEVIGSPFRVCTIKRKLDVASGFSWQDTVIAGGTSFIPAAIAHFSSDLTWGAITDTSYKNLLIGLTTPLLVTAWFNFDVVEFLQIKMKKLVYVQPLNGVFFINKISQYQINKPTRVELIRMNAVLRAEQVNLPTGGEPLQVELQGLVTK